MRCQLKLKQQAGRRFRFQPAFIQTERHMSMVVRRETRFGRREIVVLMDGSDRETTLHHACHVKPIVRA